MVPRVRWRKVATRVIAMTQTQTQTPDSHSSPMARDRKERICRGTSLQSELRGGRGREPRGRKREPKEEWTPSRSRSRPLSTMSESGGSA